MTLTNEENVVTEDAYILFYQRRLVKANAKLCDCIKYWGMATDDRMLNISKVTLFGWGGGSCYPGSGGKAIHGERKR